jgi:transcriptional regulator with XRE-family HTH domain
MFEPLGTEIRVRRKQLGMTIDGLAVAARVSRARLIALEKGDDNVTLDLLLRIVNALGITEIHIGGFRILPATPERKAAVDTIAAIQDALETLDQAVAARDQLRRATGPIADLFASVLPPASGE